MLFNLPCLSWLDDTGSYEGFTYGSQSNKEIFKFGLEH